MEIKKE
jgi:hypothetical protein